jgi:hypothetical protein
MKNLGHTAHIWGEEDWSGGCVLSGRATLVSVLGLSMAVAIKP